MSRKVTRVGRWAVYIFQGDEGDYHAVKYPKAMKRREADYRAMLMVGEMRMIKVPSPLKIEEWVKKPYIAGMGTEDLPDIVYPGTYVRECTTFSRMLCVSRNARPFAYRNELRSSSFVVPKDAIFALGFGSARVLGHCQLTFLNDKCDGEFDLNTRVVWAPTAILALEKLTIEPQHFVRGITAYVPKSKERAYIKNET